MFRLTLLGCHEVDFYVSPLTGSSRFINPSEFKGTSLMRYVMNISLNRPVQVSGLSVMVSYRLAYLADASIIQAEAVMRWSSLKVLTRAIYLSSSQLTPTSFLQTHAAIVFHRIFCNCLRFPPQNQASNRMMLDINRRQTLELLESMWLREWSSQERKFYPNWLSVRSLENGRSEGKECKTWVIWGSGARAVGCLQVFITGVLSARSWQTIRLGLINIPRLPRFLV